MTGSSAATPRFGSVDELLADARSRLDRLDVEQAASALERGARIVDIRPAWLRAQEGEISGALVVERNHLEWRLHPASDARLDAATPDQQWVVVCSEGYTSSLAADALNSIGVHARDLIGGFHAWVASGRPVSPTVTEHDQLVP